MRTQDLYEQLKYFFVKGKPLFPSRATILKRIATILFNEELSFEQRICTLETYFITSINEGNNLYSQNTFKTALKFLLAKRNYVTDRIGTVETGLLLLPFSTTRANGSKIKWQQLLDPAFVSNLNFRLADIIEKPLPMIDRLERLFEALSSLNSVKTGPQHDIEREYLSIIINNVRSSITDFRSQYEHSLWASASLEALETLKEILSNNTSPHDAFCSELNDLITRAMYYIGCSIQRNEFIGYYVAYKFRELLGIKADDYKRSLAMVLAPFTCQVDNVNQQPQYFFVSHLLEQEQTQPQNTRELLKTEEEKTTQVEKFCSMMNGDYPYGVEIVIRLLLGRDSFFRRCATQSVVICYNENYIKPFQLWLKLKKSSPFNRIWIILDSIYRNAFSNKVFSFEINHYRRIGLTDDEIHYKLLSALYIDCVHYLKDIADQFIPVCLQDLNSRLYTVIMRIINSIENDPTSNLCLTTRNRPGLLVAYFVYWAHGVNNFELMGCLARLSIEQSSYCRPQKDSDSELTPSYFGFYLFAESIWRTQLQDNPKPSIAEINLFKESLAMAKKSPWPQERHTILALITLMFILYPDDTYWLTEEERESCRTKYKESRGDARIQTLDETDNQLRFLIIDIRKLLELSMEGDMFPPAPYIFASYVLTHLQYYYYGDKMLIQCVNDLIDHLERSLLNYGYYPSGSCYVNLQTNNIEAIAPSERSVICRKLIGYLNLSERQSNFTFDDIRRFLQSLVTLSQDQSLALALPVEPFLENGEEPECDPSSTPATFVRETREFAGLAASSQCVVTSYYNPLSQAIAALLSTPHPPDSLSAKIASVFSHHPQETVLDLSLIPLGISAFKHLASALETNCTIEYLILSECGLKDDAGAYLATIFSINRRLVHVDISGNQFKKDAIFNFTIALESNPCIRLLDLSRNTLDDSCLQLIARFINCGSRLRHLNLSFNSFSCEAFFEVTPLLLSGPSLRTLDLSGTNLKMPTIDDIAKALRRKNYLHSLILSRNNLSSEDIKPLLHPSISANQLNVIDLEDNKIDDTALSLFERLLITNTQIYHLGLSNNCFTDHVALQNISNLIAENRKVIPLGLAAIGFAYVKKLRSTSQTFGLLDINLFVFLLTYCLPYPISHYTLPDGQRAFTEHKYVKQLLNFIKRFEPKENLISNPENLIASSTQAAQVSNPQGFN